MPSLLQRDICYDGNGDTYDCGYYDRSNWDSYGRWVVLTGVILAFIFVFFVFARRRAAGAMPFRGTGWAAGRTPVGHAPSQYHAAPQPQPDYYGGNQWNQHSPPPNVGPPVYVPPANQYYGENQGYFGGQQTGVELQQPEGTYQPPRGGDSVYSPPSGPPPGKDGIIR